MNVNRYGIYVKQEAGYRAFIPESFPPDINVILNEDIQYLLSRADRQLARLDGITTILPNPELFVAMYVKKEALLSSQIEGTQASLEGVLEFEADIESKENINEVKEVINYIKALNYGIDRLKEFPMSLRLIREIHKVLIEDTRGNKRSPGEFRSTQNWIGPPGLGLHDSVFVSPPPHMVGGLMGELEKFIHREDNIPLLIKIALIHSHFETIHPFLDGNGRIGRLLITFFLYWKEILNKPLLYLSYYLKKYRNEYYDLLMEIRNKGYWIRWIEFFLKGIIEVSVEAVETARKIINLKDSFTKKLFENKVGSIYAVRLLEILFETPLISTTKAIDKLGAAKTTVHNLIEKFEDLDILHEITGKKRYKKYIFKDYIEIIAKGTN